jgi:hypothetical protein
VAARHVCLVHVGAADEAATSSVPGFVQDVRRRARLLEASPVERFSPGTWASLAFLNASEARAVKLSRKGFIEWGYGLAGAPGLPTRRRENPSVPLVRCSPSRHVGSCSLG